MTRFATLTSFFLFALAGACSGKTDCEIAQDKEMMLMPKNSNAYRVIVSVVVAS